MELEEWFQQLQAQGYCPSARLMMVSKEKSQWWIEIKKWSNENHWFDTVVHTRSQSLKIAVKEAQEKMAGTTKPRFIFKPVLRILEKAKL